MSRRTNAPHCPDCPGAPIAVPLVFGLPSAEAFEAADRGEVVLGGCEVADQGQSEWACPHCHRRLGGPASTRSAGARAGEVVEPSLWDTELFPPDTLAPLGPVEADAAWRMLAQRAVLTSAVCHELQRSNGEYAGRRPHAALMLLLQWIKAHYPTGSWARAGDRLQDMPVPDGAEPLMAEVRAGVPVCEALEMLGTADYRSEYDGDMEHIRKLLERYPY